MMSRSRAKLWGVGGIALMLASVALAAPASAEGTPEETEKITVQSQIEDLEVQVDMASVPSDATVTSDDAGTLTVT